MKLSSKNNFGEILTFISIHFYKIFFGFLIFFIGFLIWDGYNIEQNTVYTDDVVSGYKMVKDLSIGDALYIKNGKTLDTTQLVSIKKIFEPQIVYNLSVNNTHTYFANDFAVHNKGEIVSINVVEIPIGSSYSFDNLPASNGTTILQAFSDNPCDQFNPQPTVGIPGLSAFQFQTYVVVNTGGPASIYYRGSPIECNDDGVLSLDSNGWDRVVALGFDNYDNRDYRSYGIHPRDEERTIERRDVYWSPNRLCEHWGRESGDHCHPRPTDTPPSGNNILSTWCGRKTEQKCRSSQNTGNEVEGENYEYFYSTIGDRDGEEWIPERDGLIMMDVAENVNMSYKELWETFTFDVDASGTYEFYVNNGLWEWIWIYEKGHPINWNNPLINDTQRYASIYLDANKTYTMKYQCRRNENIDNLFCGYGWGKAFSGDADIRLGVIRNIPETNLSVDVFDDTNGSYSCIADTGANGEPILNDNIDVDIDITESGDTYPYTFTAPESKKIVAGAINNISPTAPYETSGKVCTSNIINGYNFGFENGDTSGWWSSNTNIFSLITNPNSYVLEGDYFLGMRDDNDASTDTYVASDWFDPGLGSLQNKTVTFGFWAMAHGSETAGVGIPIDNIALQTYPQNGDWNNFSQYVNMGRIYIYPSEWHYYSFTKTFNNNPNLTNQLRVVLRAPNPNPSYVINPPPVYYDGITLTENDWITTTTPTTASPINLSSSSDTAVRVGVRICPVTPLISSPQGVFDPSTPVFVEWAGDVSGDYSVSYSLDGSSYTNISTCQNLTGNTNYTCGVDLSSQNLHGQQQVTFRVLELTCTNEDTATITVTTPAWYQINSGNVYAGGQSTIDSQAYSIYSDIPYSCKEELICSDHFVNGDYMGINNGYIIHATDADYKSGQGDFSNSDQNIILQSTDSNDFDFDSIYSRYELTDWNGDSINSGDQMYYLTNNSINGNYTLASDSNIIIFSDSDVTINNNINIPYNNGALVLIVKGDINIGPNVTQLDGFYIATGAINTGVSNKQLIINGGLVSFDTTNGVNLQRNLGDSDTTDFDNTNIPAELFNYRPDIVRSIYQSDVFENLSQSDYTWEEIAP